MRKLSVFLLMGIAGLLLSSFLYTNQQYFSFAAMLSIFLIMVLGFVTMLLSYHYESNAGSKWNRTSLAIFALLFLVSIVLVSYEASYDLEYVALSSGEFYNAAIAVMATLAFVAGLYLISIAYRSQAEKVAKSRNRYWRYALVIVLLLTLSVLLYLAQAYIARTKSWMGTDEFAFDYYASRLFVKGVNPYNTSNYNTSMMPILNAFGLNPPLELNGTCECTYDYPALSFVLPSIASFGTYPYNFMLADMILVIFVSFLLFKSTKWNAYAMLPISAWFFASFYITNASLDKYIAASLFLVLAYIYKARVLRSGIFLGLAASTHQISWFAIPFFYVLTLRESGKRAAAKSLLATAGVFLIANGYFIFLSPQKTISNMLSLFLIKLQFSGPALMELLVTFFPVTYWALTLVMMIVFVSAILLFYLYTRSLKLMLAAVPSTIFALSWRNTGYFSAFIPLIIAVYYSERGSLKDLLPNKRQMAYVLVLTVVLAAIVLAYAHSTYISSKILQIVHVYVPVNVNKKTGIATLPYIIVNVSNNANKSEAVLFYVISRSPNEWEDVPVGYKNASANAYTKYPLPYSLSVVNTTTELRVFVLSNDYIYGVEESNVLAK